MTGSRRSQAHLQQAVSDDHQQLAWDAAIPVPDVSPDVSTAAAVAQALTLRDQRRRRRALRRQAAIFAMLAAALIIAGALGYNPMYLIGLTLIWAVVLLLDLLRHAGQRALNPPEREARELLDLMQKPKRGKSKPKRSPNPLAAVDDMLAETLQSVDDQLADALDGADAVEPQDIPLPDRYNEAHQ